MPTRLSGLRLTKVDLVDQGADEHARVELFKRHDDPTEETAEMGNPTTADDPVDKRDDTDAPPTDVVAPDDTDTITKADYVALLKRAEQAEQIAQAERDLREQADLRKRLDTLGVTGDRDALTKALHTLRKADADAVDLIVSTLAAAAEQLRESKLFESVGSASPGEGSAEAELEKIAKGIADRDGVDPDTAFAKAVSQNPKLYGRMRQEA